MSVIDRGHEETWASFWASHQSDRMHISWEGTTPSKRFHLYAGDGDDIITVDKYVGEELRLYGQGGDDVFRLPDFSTQEFRASATIKGDYAQGGGRERGKGPEGNNDTIDLRNQLGESGVAVDFSINGSRLGELRFADQRMAVFDNIENIIGSIGSDTIFADDSANVISGYLGADRISGGQGNDVLHGDFEPGQISSLVPTLAQTEEWKRQFEQSLENGNHSDTIDGGSGDDKIYGELGNDTLLGGLGSDLIYGGQGNDIIYGEGNTYNTLDGGAGHDAIYGGEGEDYIFGGAGNDFLSAVFTLANDADASYNYLGGGEGHDTLVGSNAHSNLVGGSGNDKIYGGNGSEWISGGSGNDVIVAGSGTHYRLPNRIDGGAGSDRMWAGPDADTFIFRQGDGADVIHRFNWLRDKVEFRGTGESYSDLRIMDTEDGAVITYGDNPEDEITFRGVSASHLIEDVFVFDFV